jgi:hypothetical protein
VALILEWPVADPGILGARLADHLRLPHPDPDARGVELILRGGRIVLRRLETGESERLRIARPDDTRGAPGTGLASLLGVGFATVEAERAAVEIGALVGLAPASFAPGVADGWLGARTWIAAGDVAILLLEPSTEGRLAAALARAGEGAVVAYVGMPGPAMGPTRPGPLGPAALVYEARPWGPYLLTVARSEAAGTIGR